MAIRIKDKTNIVDAMSIKGRRVAVLVECLSVTCIAGTSGNIISDATLRNWARMGEDSDGKLRARANKRLSTKHIIPSEYFCARENVRLAEKITNAACIAKAEPREVIYSLALELVKQEGLSDRESVRRLIAEYCEWSPKFVSWDVTCPVNERDWLGGIYQCLLSEGIRNEGGVYYTHEQTVQDMVSHCKLNKESLFLDPCCGSGAIFFALRNLSPRNIFGIDKDPVAVFIAKLNLLRMFPDEEFDPQVYCCDYLHPTGSQRSWPVFTNSFDCIATNPPWGAVGDTPNECEGEITSGETFALFYVKAYKQLGANATISFLLPESILNVRTHRDLREFILRHGSLEIITHYNGSFSGVTTKYIGVVARNVTTPSITIQHVFEGDDIRRVSSRDMILASENLALDYVDKQDQLLLDKISLAGRHNLKKSDWALGIVTGDNKRKLADAPVAGFEPIFTGKEVLPFRLKAPSKFIQYDRSQFQQVAKDSYYRAREKLVYKFISDRPVFAYDDTGALFLNSANILIPRVEGMSTKTVLALLNSDVLQYYYRQKFRGLKVLKSNLCALPLPQLSQEMEQRIAEMSSVVITGDYSQYRELQYIIGACYGISSNEVDIITERTNGEVNKILDGKDQ